MTPFHFILIPLWVLYYDVYVFLSTPPLSSPALFFLEVPPEVPDSKKLPGCPRTAGSLLSLNSCIHIHVRTNNKNIPMKKAISTTQLTIATQIPELPSLVSILSTPYI